MAYKQFGISQSSIKDWRELTPQDWYKKWILREGKQRKSDALDFGNLLDILCFSSEKYNDDFIETELSKPSANVEKIMVSTYNHIVELNENIKELNKENNPGIPLRKFNLPDNKEIVIKFCQEEDYYANNLEQAYNTAVKKGAAYFEFLQSVGDRIVITKDQKTLADELKTILYTNKKTSGFFKNTKTTEVVFQQELYGEHIVSGLPEDATLDFLPTQGKPDILFLNHKRKHIREIDLKYTEYPIHKWHLKGGPMWKLDYPLQHSFYNTLLRTFLNTYKDGKYKDYAIVNPLNVVIDDKVKLPYLFEYSLDDLHIKQKGIEGTDIRGWEDDINDIAWHMHMNDWSYPTEHLKHGKIRIKLFNRK